MRSKIEKVKFPQQIRITKVFTYHMDPVLLAFTTGIVELVRRYIDEGRQVAVVCAEDTSRQTLSIIHVLSDMKIDMRSLYR